MFPLANLHFELGVDYVPKSIVANFLNLLCICSDNQSFFGAYLQNGCIAGTSNFDTV